MSLTPLTNNSPKSLDSRPPRTNKCPGCHLEHSQHNFGIPGPNCTGPVPNSANSSTSPIPPPLTIIKTPITSSSGTIRRRSKNTPAVSGASAAQIEDQNRLAPSANDHIARMNAELALLENEEQILRQEIEEEEARLSREIENRKRTIQNLRANRAPPAQFDAPSYPSSRHQTSALQGSASHQPAQARQADTNVSWNRNFSRTENGLDQAYLRLPSTLPHIVSTSQERSTSQSLFPDRPALDRYAPTINQSEILLRPTRTIDPTRGKPLRIIDFVSRIRPSEDERIFASDNNCVLKLSLQDTKPKLSSVTVEQYNIANLRIFYELLFSNKLSSMQEIREYLAYSIKILELAAKNTWQSVLLYDDEFRVLQHTYGYPWSTDHSHLHEVSLVPRWAAKSNATGASHNSSNNPSLGNLKSFTVARLPNGEEICRLFNSKKGCQRSPCRYTHVCNRKVGSQACGQNHQGYLHPPPGDGPQGR